VGRREGRKSPIGRKAPSEGPWGLGARKKYTSSAVSLLGGRSWDGPRRKGRTVVNRVKGLKERGGREGKMTESRKRGAPGFVARF